MSTGRMIFNSQKGHHANTPASGQMIGNIEDGQPFAKWIRERSEPQSTVDSLLPTITTPKQALDLPVSAQIDTTISLSATCYTSDSRVFLHPSGNPTAPLGPSKGGIAGPTGVTLYYEILFKDMGGWSEHKSGAQDRRRPRRVPENDLPYPVISRKPSQRAVLHQNAQLPDRSLNRSGGTQAPRSYIMTDSTGQLNRVSDVVVDQRGVPIQLKTPVDQEFEAPVPTGDQDHQCRCGLKRKSTLEFHKHLAEAHPSVMRRFEAVRVSRRDDGSQLCVDADQQSTNPPGGAFQATPTSQQLTGQGSRATPSLQGGQNTPSNNTPRIDPTARGNRHGHTQKPLFACPHWKAGGAIARHSCARRRAKTISQLM